MSLESTCRNYSIVQFSLRDLACRCCCLVQLYPRSLHPRLAASGVLQLRRLLQHFYSSLSTIIREFPLAFNIFWYFSIEHPFLRSDNRHFVFYIWRRTIKRHSLGKYIAVPVYFASARTVLTALSYSQSTLFVMGLTGCIALTIVPSPLLEFRYYVLPYLFWRLHLSPTLVENGKWRGIAEYIWFEAVNFVTLWIFITRPFTWDSEPGKTQRFIW